MYDFNIKFSPIRKRTYLIYLIYIFIIIYLYINEELILHQSLRNIIDASIHRQIHLLIFISLQLFFLIFYFLFLQFNFLRE